MTLSRLWTMRLPEPAPHAAPAGVRVDAHEELTLATGWRAAACAPDSQLDPARLDGLDWLPARVPGTAAAALYDASRWRPGDGSDLDAEDWWFHTRFDAPASREHELVTLELDGLATLAEVFLNGTRVLTSESMFAAHSLDVGALLRGENELAIRCLALAPKLAERRKPRARWRTRLVDGNLRFFRTMVLGRAPGFAPEPAAVGPWRPVRLTRRRTLIVEQLLVRPRLEDERDDADGLLDVIAGVRSLAGADIASVQLELVGPSGSHSIALELTTTAGLTTAEGTLRVPEVARWWPHTHGDPALHDVRLVVRTAGATTTVHTRRVGFRSLRQGEGEDHDVEVDGLDLHVNGVRVFTRGAVWTPPDPVGLAPSNASLRTTIERALDAGMNMLRIPGTSVYESSAFHDLCDELGLLVWQDFMFANLDYPIADEPFRTAVQEEAELVLAEIAGRPSLAVLCGNSEIEQQVAMLGLDPALGRGELFGQLLPALIAAASTDAVYVPSAPCGGTLPFRPERGIANYYGVGGYRRPLEDARRAEVRFAAECLAFSNVPDEQGVEAVMDGSRENAAAHHPRWKAGVPRDAGSGWDFEDVRDHYLATMFGVDASELRRFDHDHYLELSRAVSGEAMAEVFGEWRRAASPCGGGLVLWLKDLRPGAGWGVLDHEGRPKPAYHHLRRALAPVCVWMTDEGLGGMRVHLANDRGTPLPARLRVALYRAGEQLVAEASEDLVLPPHANAERDVEALLGHFLDASWAYRFGPPGHDVVVASLEGDDGAGGRRPLSQAFRFPAGRPLRQQTNDQLGLRGTLAAAAEGTLALSLSTTRLAYGVRILVPGFRPSDDALTLEPGGVSYITLSPEFDDVRAPQGTDGSLTALNLRGSVRVPLDSS
jgi:beta-mannosidase